MSAVLPVPSNMCAATCVAPLHRLSRGLHSKSATARIKPQPLVSCVTVRSPSTSPQALLDVYTIKREIGRLENFSIALVGDLANGRTVRSLAYLLSMYPGVKMYFVAPEVVRMKDDIKQYLDRCDHDGTPLQSLPTQHAAVLTTCILLHTM